MSVIVTEMHLNAGGGKGVGNAPFIYLGVKYFPQSHARGSRKLLREKEERSERDLFTQSSPERSSTP
jgi:hypothetical protein